MNVIALIAICALPPAPTPATRALPSPIGEVGASSVRVSLIMGSVLVPQGSVSYVTGGSVDHFYGYIEVSHPARRIDYAVGMVGRRPRGLRARGYIWLKRERLAGGGRLTYGLRVEGGKHLIDANVGVGNFSMASAGAADIDAFLSVVRTYGQCSGCPAPISRRAAT